MKKITYRSSTVDSIMKTAAQTTRTDKEIKDAMYEANCLIISSAKRVFRTEPDTIAVIRTAIQEYEHAFETFLGEKEQYDENGSSKASS